MLYPNSLTKRNRNTMKEYEN